MNPAVEAAWIAASVGIAGIAGTLAATAIGAGSARRVAAHTLAAERDLRRWEKRAAAYEEAMAYLVQRRAALDRMTAAHKAGQGFQAILAAGVSGNAPMSAEIQGRLMAYASEAVRQAVERMVSYDGALANLATAAGIKPLDPEQPDTVISVITSVLKADQKLADAIRDELADLLPNAADEHAAELNQ